MDNSQTYLSNICPGPGSLLPAWTSYIIKQIAGLLSYLKIYYLYKGWLWVRVICLCTKRAKLLLISFHHVFNSFTAARSRAWKQMSQFCAQNMLIAYFILNTIIYNIVIKHIGWSNKTQCLLKPHLGTVFQNTRI